MEHLDTWVNKLLREYRKDENLAKMIITGTKIYSKLPSYAYVENSDVYYRKMQSKHNFVYELITHKIRYDNGTKQEP